MTPGVTELLSAELAADAPDFAVAILETAMMLPDDPMLQARCLRSEMLRRYRLNKSKLSRRLLEWLVDELAAGPDDLGDLKEEMARRYKLGWAVGAETWVAVANAEYDRHHGTDLAKIGGTRERVSRRFHELRLKGTPLGTLQPDTIKKGAPTFAPVAHLWAEHFCRSELQKATAFPCQPDELGQFVANALLIQEMAERLRSHARAGRAETIMRAGVAVRLPESFVDWLPAQAEALVFEI